MPEVDCLIVTCEHGGNRVPKGLAHLFEKRRGLLRTHRGYDPGALILAQAIARQLHVPLHVSTVSRLIVDLNRSVDSPALFSDATKRLSPAEQRSILARYYTPFRRGVERRIAAWVARGMKVVHLSIHTFTPVLRGVTRKAHVGLLYDPARPNEKEFCRKWRARLQREWPNLRVRLNYPYHGASDSFTAALRKRFPADQYYGIELEVNQRLAARDPAAQRRIRQVILTTLRYVLGGST